MKALLLCLSLFLGAQAFAADQRLTFADGTVLADVTWLQPPRAPEENVMLIEWKDAAGRQIEPPGAFKVVVWMPDMGHGSSPTKIARYADRSGRPTVGMYRVSDIYFTMGGYWEVQVKLRYNGGEETQVVPATIAW